jgi:hypothetical protein
MSFAMLRRALHAAVAVLFLCAGQAAMADEPWTLAKDSDGIAVHTRSVPGSQLKAFKGEVDLPVSVDHVLEAIGDADSLRVWLPDAAQCLMLRSTDTERWVYVETEAPWPVSNRDGVYHFTFVRDVGDEAATVRVEAVPEYVPRIDGLVRIPKSDGYWRIEARGAGVHASYQIHADPGGLVPAWLANATVVRFPFKTLRNLRRHLETARPAGTSR